MKEKGYKKIIVGLLGVSIILSGLLPVATVQQAVVSIPDVLDVPVGGTADVNLNITADDTDGVGSARIRVLFDESVVNIQSVSDGVNPTTNELSVANANGELNLSWATGGHPGPGADGQPFIFAVITLKAVGSAGESSDLDVVIDRLKDATLDTNDIPVPDQDGTFSIEEEVTELTADAGGPYSGYVDQPITFTGSASGGVPLYTYEWDLDNDGEYDDATGAVASKSWSTAGTYTIGLKVTDSDSPENTDTGTTTVGVREAPANLVSITDVSANNSETVMMPINIINVTDLGAAIIWLSYNKSVVIVDEVSDGNLGSITAGIDNTSGVTKISWFAATGKTGDFVFAYVTLKVVGSTEKTSMLGLDVEKLVDTGNNPITHTVDDGVFTVSGPLLTPTSTPSPTLSPILTPEVIPTPSITPVITPTAIPQVTPTPKPSVEETPSPTPSPTPTPGFEAVFAIACLFAVAYLVLRKKGKA
jgi:PGF-CTERM protein